MARRLLLGLLLGAGCLDKNPEFVPPASTGVSGSTGVPVTTGDSEAPTGSTDTGSPTTPTGGTGADSATGAISTSSTTGDSPDTENIHMTGGPQCGDGKLEQGEECDDGNQEDLDACSNTCIPAYCGDGVTQKGEECDDANTDQFDECLGDCVKAQCGDGIVWAGVEECDDGNIVGGDDCEKTCFHTPRTVFVTSALFNGDLGGLDGADLKCQALAKAAGLQGKFQAWISAMDGFPATRMTPGPGAYVMVDGTVVAESWAALISNSLLHSIDTTEKGMVGGPMSDGCIQSAVYTNTFADGIGAGPMTDCQGWTSKEGPSLWGSWEETGKGWSNQCQGFGCHTMAALYCFQQ